MPSRSAPTFDELSKPSRHRKGNAYLLVHFEHGTVAFWGRHDKKRAKIEVDLGRSRDLLPGVSDELTRRHGEYLNSNSSICRGGAMTTFGRTTMNFHVLIEDADKWLRDVFATVSDPKNFEPPKTFEQVTRETLNQLRSGSGGSRPKKKTPKPKSSVAVTEGSQSVKTRGGQSAFSDAVKANHGYRCCFPGCAVDVNALLVGAHIERWSDSPESRGEISNGLCLCALHDRAFEIGIFVLTDDFRVRVARPGKLESDWVKDALLPMDDQQIQVGQIAPSVEAIRGHRRRHGGIGRKKSKRPPATGAPASG